MGSSRASFNAVIVGIFGFLLYLIITVSLYVAWLSSFVYWAQINNHKDEVHSKELLTKVSAEMNSNLDAEKALAMMNEVKMLGFCYDDCKLLFGRLHNHKGEWNVALNYCSEVRNDAIP